MKPAATNCATVLKCWHQERPRPGQPALPQARDGTAFAQTRKANDFPNGNPVRTRHVVKLEPYGKDSHVVTLNDGTRLPVSRTGYGRLRSLLEQ